MNVDEPKTYVRFIAICVPLFQPTLKQDKAEIMYVCITAVASNKHYYYYNIII